MNYRLLKVLIICWIGIIAGAAFAAETITRPLQDGHAHCENLGAKTFVVFRVTNDTVVSHAELNLKAYYSTTNGTGSWLGIPTLNATAAWSEGRQGYLAKINVKGIALTLFFDHLNDSDGGFRLRHSKFDSDSKDLLRTIIQEQHTQKQVEQVVADVETVVAETTDFELPDGSRPNLWFRFCQWVEDSGEGTLHNLGLNRAGQMRRYKQDRYQTAIHSATFTADEKSKFNATWYLDHEQAILAAITARVERELQSEGWIR